MAFSPASGRWVTRGVPTKTATTYTAGMLVYNDNTDNVPATTTTQQNILGIAKEDKASAASSVTIMLLVPSGTDCTMNASATGTLTAAMVGDQFDIASGGLSVAQAASTYDTVTLTKFISASEGEFALNYTTGVEN